MGNLTIKKQVLIASGLAIFFFLATTIFSSIVTTEVKQKEKLRDLEIIAQMTMKDSRYYIVQIQQFLTDAALTGNSEAIDEARENKNEVLAISVKFIKTNPHLTDEVNEIIALINRLYATGEEMIAVYKASGQQAGNQIMTQATTGFDARSIVLADKFEALSTHVTKKEQRLQQELDRATEYLNTVIMASSVIQIMLLLGLVSLIFLRVLPAIKRLNTNIFDLSQGDKDLTRRLTIRKKDELCAIAQSVNHFTEDLDTMIAAIGYASKRLENDTQSFREDATQSSKGMQEVQTHTDMLATAINEMASTVLEVARNTEQAAEIAQSTRETTISGETIVKDSIEIINTLATDIDESASQIQSLVQLSEKIGDIINVIKSISDQTNLLALNAAIEAARAGDAGRGFAVVADEVRALAKSTQDSAAEIENMISQIQNESQRVSTSMQNNIDKASTTVTKAEQAGESLRDIAESVNQLADVNVQIATASEQQSAVSEEINQSILQVANLATETLNLSKRVGLASIECSFSASEVTDLVSQFKTTEYKIDHNDNNLVDWSEAYSVHVPSIDQQHRQIFEMINTVYKLVVSNNIENINKPLNELVGFAKKHLSDEEEILEKVSYPDLTAHKQVHVNLLNDIDKLYQQCNTDDLASFFELLMFLKNWLVDHIYKVDMKYSGLLVSKGIK